MITRSWKTFQGKDVTFSTIDQQHLSNIFYFWKYTCPHLGFPPGIKEMEEMQAIIQEELDSRFNGQLLPYRPHVKFKEEIAALTKAGYLKKDGTIVIHGFSIGEVITMENMPELKQF